MNLEEQINSIKSLPPCPRMLPDLQALISDPSATSDDMAELIRLDASLAAQVILVSNSAQMGYASAAEDIREAVNRIGFQDIYRIVGILVSKQLFSKNNNAYEMNAKEIWEHSIAVALAMEEMASFCGVMPASAYTVGLLHSIGKIVINEIASDQYAKVFETIDSENISMVQAENKILGFNHNEASEALLKKWEFPSQIIEPIAYQSKPEISSEYKKLTCMLHMANWLAGIIGINPGRSAWAIELHSAASDIVGLSDSNLQMIALDVREKFYTLQEKVIGSLA